MIINSQRNPKYSLYYLGAVILKELQKDKSKNIECLIDDVQKKLEEKINVNFIYYALEWLFLLGVVTIKEGMLCYEDSRINSA